MKTLVLYSAYSDKISYFDDWIDAFKDHDVFETSCFNTFDVSKDLLEDINRKIETYELVIIHHSMNGDTLKYLKPFVGALKNRRGKLVSFVGNEINLPTIGMAKKIKNLQDIEADFIATQLLEEAGQWLYQDCVKSKIISLPHALNPKAFSPNVDLNSRKIDIGTRSARYGVYIGDNDRNHIIRFFHQNTDKLKLTTDLGVGNTSIKRFNREGWASFLSSCKATLSTEAGSFFLEKDDKTVNAIQKFLVSKSKKIVLPNETIARKLYRKFVPRSLRKVVISLLENKLVEVGNLDENCHFDDIYKSFFSDTLKCPVYSKAISSRHFDAIGTKTLHVMYPGRYNDILQPREHYFELKRDHSNIYELVELLSDIKLVKNTTDNAYEYVMANHTHKHRLDSLLSYMNF